MDSSVLLPLVGFREEKRRVREAFLAGESLVILGPRGAGKTRILRSALTDTGRPAVYFTPPPVPHEFLARLSVALAQRQHPGFVRDLPDAQSRAKWLAKQTSVRLRGLLWSAFEAEPVPLILDGVAAAGPGLYRFVERLYFTPGVTIIAAARDRRRLGTLERLFWDPRHVVQLGPLRPSEALALFASAVTHFQLDALDLDDFRERVLASAHGNPGQIVEMCRRAAEPCYQSGRHIKFAPLRIDTMMRFLD